MTAGDERFPLFAAARGAGRSLLVGRKRPARRAAAKRGGVFTLLVVVLGGCAGSKVPTVELTGTKLGRPTAESFTRAFVAQNDVGEDQVVVVDSPLDHPREAGPAGPLERVPPPLVTQVLSIRLHWRANGAAAGSPAAMNAVLHWYAYDSPSGTNPGFVDYVGTGFVTLTPTDGGATVTVEHGSMSPVDRIGSLHDPFGSFRVDGTFRAVADGDQLRQAQADVRAAEARARAAEHPPATRPATVPVDVQTPTSVPTTPVGPLLPPP